MFNRIHLAQKNLKLWLLKLVRTNLYYCVLGTSTAAIFLSNDHSLYSPIYFGWTSCLISFVWDRSTCQKRVESDKIQHEKVLLTVGIKPRTLQFEVWCFTDWAYRAWWKLFNLIDLYTYMYFQYHCIYWYKFENDEWEWVCLVNALFCFTYWNKSILYK